MATKKKAAPQKPPKSRKPQKPTPDHSAMPREPALPPPDDPLRRSNEFDAGRGLDSREMALKRLEAIRQTQEMPTEDEEPPAKAQE
ncbi:MAG TPA: hypothetical protein VF659_10660 [Pyrinomonadaceae bacterium]|jgi:hypothetical protein